jgi:hypothetical protein
VIPLEYEAKPPPPPSHTYKSYVPKEREIGDKNEFPTGVTTTKKPEKILG